MKQFSIEEKAKRYDEVVAMAKECITYIPDEVVNKYMLNMFPELKESEDERIRKELINFVKSRLAGFPQCEKYIFWLEKQDSTSIKWNKNVEGNKPSVNHSILMKTMQGIAEGEWKGESWYQYRWKARVKDSDVLFWAELSALDEQDKLKYHEGDWIVYDNNVYKIVNTPHNDSYECLGIENTIRVYNSCIDNKSHLWTIEDAKEGDVLTYVTDEGDLWIMIYWSLYEPYEGHVHYHALSVNDNFTDKGTCCICIDNLKPATKEQRDKLEEAMLKAGYKWDADKKELIKL